MRVILYKLSCRASRALVLAPAFVNAVNLNRVLAAIQGLIDMVSRILVAS